MNEAIYEPAIRSGLVHSLVAALLRFRIPSVELGRRDSLDGGGSLQWYAGDGSRGVVLLVPGVSGDAGSLYMRSAAAFFGARGWECAAVVGRGWGGSPLGSFRGSAPWDEILSAGKHIRRGRAPAEVLCALGFSMGALLVGRALSEAEPGLFNAAYCVSCPFDPLRTYFLPNSAPWWKWLRDWILASGLRAFVNLHRAAILDGVRHSDDFAPEVSSALRAVAQKWPGVGTIHALDAATWVAQNPARWSSLQAFYEELACSPGRMLRIRTPTVFLSALDDPAIPASVTCSSVVQTEYVTCVVIPHGGHLAFRRPSHLFTGPCYFEEAALSHFEQLTCPDGFPIGRSNFGG